MKLKPAPAVQSQQNNAHLITSLLREFERLIAAGCELIVKPQVIKLSLPFRFQFQ